MIFSRQTGVLFTLADLVIRMMREVTAEIGSLLKNKSTVKIKRIRKVQEKIENTIFWLNFQTKTR